MKNFSLQKTSNPDLFRVVDLQGDWKRYFHKKSKKYLWGVTHILKIGYAKPRLMEYLKNGSPEEIDKKLKEAGEKGDSVHQLIRLFFDKGGKLAITDDILAENNKDLRKPTIEEWQTFLAFTKFWVDHAPILYQYEFSVFNLKYGYAGTVDAVIELTKKCDYKLCGCAKFVGKVGLVDWKSGSGIWPDYGPQTASYGNSDQMRKTKKKLEYTAIIRIGTRHARKYEVEFYDKPESKANWERFLAAYAIAKPELKAFNPEKEIYEIQESVALEVKKPKNDKANKTK